MSFLFILKFIPIYSFRTWLPIEVDVETRGINLCVAHVAVPTGCVLVRDFAIR